MQEQFGWSELQVGIVLGTFYVGYMISMTLGGYLADKYGGKKVLGYALIIWSLFTIVTHFCIQWIMVAYFYKNFIRSR